MALTYTPIATTTLGSATGTVTFSSIPQTYTDIILVASAKAVTASATDSFGIAINGDGSALYSRTYLQGDGSSAASGRQTAQIRIVSDYVMGTAGTDWGTYTWNFMNYTNSTTFKTTLYRGSNASNSGGFNAQATVYLYRSTSAITSLVITTMNGPNWAAGSTFTLYGVKAA